MNQSTTQYHGVSRTQSLALLVWGVVLWFVAALITRVVGPLGAYQGMGTAALYALIIPGTVPVLYLTRLIMGLRPNQTAVAMTIVTMAALFCDGIAFAAIRQLYWADSTSAAGSILWGAAVAIGLGFAMNGRD